MAAVLCSEKSNFFSPTSLRRSQSQTTFAPASSHHASACKLEHPFAPPPTLYSESDQSSVSSSPTIQPESTDISFASTPASSNLSISSDYDEPLAIDFSPEDHFSLPLLSQDKFLLEPEIHHIDTLDTPLSPKTGESYTLSSADSDNLDSSSTSETPDLVEHAEDDSAVITKPSRQVDYLSHDWREEDIWSSWRYIISRREEFPNSRRLENASWRTWMKARNNLKTISPEELNWLKDCDVTWLYGPLQSGSSCFHPSQSAPTNSCRSKSESMAHYHKKPILKKRSMSEVMLQRSLTASSLLKQATAAVQAQETRACLRPKMGRSNTDCYVTYPLSLRRTSNGHSSSLVPSTNSSGASSPSLYPERKHIHFNEQVEQCIAVEIKGDDDDDVDLDRYGDDSDSDEGVMMKRVTPKKRGPLLKKRSMVKTPPTEGKTIAKLPSTTLKYREDMPDCTDSSTLKYSSGNLSLNTSSSQETLRPSRHTSHFYWGEQDPDIDDGPFSLDSSWPCLNGTTSRSVSPTNSTEEPVGMRRTPSGMFMPCEEDEGSGGDGILDRVIDTVNTARDIAHVIWNVGWRK
ncbi:hypothetical protein CDD82_7202 [Ophiocordyceps australis]|uniref:Nitrogen regulatory protein areA GATA-like domain-containing protein n=1 Tax=Ophiocordyceps australis TaxID=1399860 RepID=A0A2C5YTI4_9HYPO|nr:hypothetical protein CDD82_7202 [Ophiocordyceps australis]